MEEEEEEEEEGEAAEEAEEGAEAGAAAAFALVGDALAPALGVAEVALSAEGLGELALAAPAPAPDAEAEVAEVVAGGLALRPLLLASAAA